MVAWLVYCGVCFVAGLLLSFVVMLLRSGPGRSGGSVKTVIACLIASYATPFLYSEALTKCLGGQVEDAVREAYRQSPIQGPLLYYRVTWFTGQHAKVLVIGQEPDVWEGTDHPVLAVNLDKTDGVWKAADYEVVYASKNNAEGTYFPPYH